MTSFTQDILELKNWHDRRRHSDRKRLVVEEPQSRPVEINRGTVPEYIPTLAEIRAACLEIQAEWSPAERRRRAGMLNRIRPMQIVHVADHSAND